MGLLMLDLDGTLVESSLEEVDGKLGPAPGLFTEPRLRPNVFEVIQRAAFEEDEFAIITNQGGVAWGYATEEECYARIGRTVALLNGFFGQPFSIHVCFTHIRATIPRYREERGEERRKPSATMLREALVAHREDWKSPHVLRDVLMVGDLDADKEAAAAAGVDFVPAAEFFVW